MGRTSYVKYLCAAMETYRPDSDWSDIALRIEHDLDSSFLSKASQRDYTGFLGEAFAFRALRFAKKRLKGNFAVTIQPRIRSNGILRAEKQPLGCLDLHKIGGDQVAEYDGIARLTAHDGARVTKRTQYVIIESKIGCWTYFHRNGKTTPVDCETELKTIEGMVKQGLNPFENKSPKLLDKSGVKKSLLPRFYERKLAHLKSLVGNNVHYVVLMPRDIKEDMIKNNVPAYKYRSSRVHVISFPNTLSEIRGISANLYEQRKE